MFRLLTSCVDLSWVAPALATRIARTARRLDLALYRAEGVLEDVAESFSDRLSPLHGSLSKVEDALLTHTPERRELKRLIAELRARDGRRVSPTPPRGDSHPLAGGPGEASTSSAGDS